MGIGKHLKKSGFLLFAIHTIIGCPEPCLNGISVVLDTTRRQFLQLINNTAGIPLILVNKDMALFYNQLATRPVAVPQFVVIGASKLLHISETFQLFKGCKELPTNFGVVLNESSKDFWLMAINSNALKQIAQSWVVIDERKCEGQIIEGDALVSEVKTGEVAVRHPLTLTLDYFIVHVVQQVANQIAAGAVIRNDFTATFQVFKEDNLFCSLGRLQF